MKTKTVFPMPAALVEALAALPSEHKGSITFDEARRWCHEAHAQVGQTYGEHPYGYHLDAVDASAVAWGFGDDILIRILCQSHDVFEDTAKTYAQMLAAGFSAESVILAWRLKDEDGKTRAEKKHVTLPKISEDWRAIVGKMCDRRANGLSSRTNAPSKFKRYCQEYPEFKRELYDPKDERLAAAWAELDELFGAV